MRAGFDQFSLMVDISHSLCSPPKPSNSGIF